MGILGFLFNDPTSPFNNPLSPGNLSQEMSRRSTVLARRLVSMNAKRKNEADTLRTAVARLMLVVETQHRMLLEKGVCTKEEFDALLHAVDAEDGLVDGQRKP
jgi:hypothetical protein